MTVKRLACWLALPLLTAAVLLGAYNESVSRDQQRQLDALKQQLRKTRPAPERRHFSGTWEWVADHDNGDGTRGAWKLPNPWGDKDHAWADPVWSTDCPCQDPLRVGE